MDIGSRRRTSRVCSQVSSVIDATLLNDKAKRLALSRGWGEMQHDLLHLVCDCLHPDARWAMRLVSAHWRDASEQSACGQQLVVNTTAQHLSPKIAVLKTWRTLGKSRDCSFNFVVIAPVLLQDLASRVEDLSIQVSFNSVFVEASTHAQHLCI